MALAKVFERIAGPDAPVEFRAYDGSEAGVAGAPVRITVRSPVALSYIAQAPGWLGPTSPGISTSTATRTPHSPGSPRSSR